MPIASPSTPGSNTLAEQELNNSLVWLIQLRWLAGICVLPATWFATAVLEINLPAVPLYLLGLGILGYNVLLWWGLKQLNANPANSIAVYQSFARFQIALDWIAMALLIHFSGGIESPALYYFLFHITIASLLLPHDLGFFYVTLAPLLVGGIAFFEYHGTITHHCLFNPSRCGNSLYIAAVFFFFTAACYIMAYLSMTISRRLRRREDELAGLYQSLKDLDKDKSRFVHTVTHELRSPTRVVSSLLNVLERGYVGDLNEKQSDLINRAQRRLQFLQTLIDDLLDLAAGKVDSLTSGEQSPISLTDVLLQVQARFKTPARNKKLSLRLEYPTEKLMVWGKQNELDRMMSNLVSNAIKYTRQGEVRLLLERINNSARITIADTGIGVPEEAQAHLFEEFYRAGNAKAMEESGTGLGLSIVKDLVERYNGNIEVHSVKGQGTTFTITLPL